MKAHPGVCCALLGVAGALALAAPVASDEPDAAALLAEHAYEVRIEDGKLAGSAAAFLAAAGAKAQFVALGEVHNNREIPIFTTALYRLLREASGFQFLILEQDPVMMQRVSRLPAKGNADAVRALARRYLHGFTFISDQELQMIADVGALGSSRANVIWGCEQAFGVTHVLDELIERTPDSKRREIARRLRTEAAAAEATRDLEQGHYIGGPEFASVIGELVDAFAGVGDGHTRFLVDALTRSAEIYGYFYAGDRGEVPGYYSNNSVREEYMKTRCLEEYRLASALDQRAPRGILKHGHWHLYEGQSPGRVPTLGSFMSAVARTNEMGFFSIAAYAFNAEGAYGPFAGGKWNAFLKPFAPAVGDDRWTLVDLRAFREYPNRRLLEQSAALEESAVEDLRRLVYGYDSVLFIGGAQPATYETTGVEY